MIRAIKAEGHFLQKSILFVNEQIFPENGKVFHDFGLGFLPFCKYNVTKSEPLFLAIGMVNLNIMGLSFNMHSINKDIFGYGKTKNFIAGYLDNDWLLTEMMDIVPNFKCGKFISSNPILDMGDKNIVFGGVKGRNFGLLVTSKQDVSNFFGNIFWLKFYSILIYNYFSFNSDKKFNNFANSKDKDEYCQNPKMLNNTFIVYRNAIIFGLIKYNCYIYDIEELKKALFISLNLYGILSRFIKINDTYNIILTATAEGKFTIKLSFFCISFIFFYDGGNWSVSITLVPYIDIIKHINSKFITKNNSNIL